MKKKIKKSKAVKDMKPENHPSITWDIIKLPNGSYQWIAKARG